MKNNYLFFSSKVTVLWFILLGLLISFSDISAQSVVGQYGRLRVQGNQIVDKNGDPVSLAGNSLFWSNAGDVADYYNSTTVNHLADDWNSSIVRAAMGVKETWDGGTGYIDNPQQQEAKIRKVIDAAIAKGIYVIVDWHSHEAERYQSEAVSFFRKMARLYGNRPNIIYEIYNEPINQSWSEIKTYAQAVTAAIRSEDPDNLIIVGTPFYSQRVDVASNNPLSDNNTAYTLHFYAGTHRQELRDKATQAMNNGIALFVTEWGSVSASGDGAIAEAETQRWMDFLREKNISHANWTVADKAESSCIVQPGKGVSGLTSNQLTPSGRLVKGIIQNWSDNPGGGGENSAPTVSFISPSGDLTLQGGYDLDIEVRASDTDGSIATVALYIDDGLIRIERRAPYTWGHGGSPNPEELNGLSSGTYVFRAVATDNDGGTGEALFTLTVQKNGSGGGGTTTCNFNTPSRNSLPSVSKTYRNVYVLGEGGPNLSNIAELRINWANESWGNGLWEMAFQTNNGIPDWWNDLRQNSSNTFAASSPSVTFTNSGFPGLDGSYWVTLDGSNFVMVSKTDDFAIYFSNSSTAPPCGNNARRASGIKETVSSPDDLAEPFSVYPNPTSDYLIVKGVEADATIRVLTVLGQEKEIVKSQNRIDVTSFQPGMYILDINGRKSSFIKE